MGYGRDASCCERECLGALRGGVVSHGRISVLRRRQVIAAAAAADALPLLSDVAHDASSDDSGDESKGRPGLTTPTVGRSQSRVFYRGASKSNSMSSII